MIAPGPVASRSVDAATPLLVFPCNGNGIEALDCLDVGFRVLGFVDDMPDKQGATMHGHLVHARTAFARWPEAMVLAVPGSPTSYRSRREVIDGLGLPGHRFATVIHPTARISPLASIGRNVLVMAGVVVTSNAVIGDHVCILPNTVIHHDVRIESWSLIGSNVTIAGGSVIEENCYVGSGTNIINGVRLGASTLVGLGSNVVHSTAAGSRVYGNPATARSRADTS